MATLPLNEMKKSADAIRALALDAVQKANSGHTGTAMALADAAVVLFTQHMQFDPRHPTWVNRDRFVLSVGHASMLQYALLHLFGYDVSMDDIKQFRQYGSITPGHPEVHETPGVEMTTGPLGQGIATAVGMAMAEAHLASRFNRDDYSIVDHHTYVFAGDGDMMEGVSHEACALAGRLGLGKLIVFYDDNKITIDGGTDITMDEDVAMRFAAYGWHTIRVADGHDMQSVHDAITAAKANTGRPTLISMRTRIGYMHPKEGTSKAHGALTDEGELLAAKAAIGWQYDKFTVPDDVYAYMRGAGLRAAESYPAWQSMFQKYAAAHPDLPMPFVQAFKNELPENWQAALPTFGSDVKQATRAASGKVLAAIAPLIETMLGGSADLTGSNKTNFDNMGEFHEGPSGRYVRYGVREHGMGAIMNGLALHGGVRPYGGTFLVFSDYMRPSIRMAAIMDQPVIYVFTHDGIGVGEDGPTHQPIEHVMSLRTIPNLTVVRPADGNETAAAWQIALENKHGPTALALTRQSLPTYANSAENGLRGAYVLSDVANPLAIVMATGSEVEIAMDAQQQLAAAGIPVRVVSMPSWELFDQQSADYRNSVLPAHITARVSIEAGTTLGWAKYVGPFGKSIGLDRFGASAPFKTVYEQLGLTPQAVVDAVKGILG